MKPLDLFAVKIEMAIGVTVIAHYMRKEPVGNSFNVALVRLITDINGHKESRNIPGNMQIMDGRTPCAKL